MRRGQCATCYTNVEVDDQNRPKLHRPLVQFEDCQAGWHTDPEFCHGAVAHDIYETED